MIKAIFTVVGVVLLGALGALLFNIFLLPNLLTSPYFENYQFVKDFKEGKIVVNQKEQVYIQESTALESAIEKVKNSVATIQSQSLGVKSGFIATSDGSIVTVASAVPLNNNVKVFLTGESVEFTVVKRDTKNNLLLLKVNKNDLQTLGFANTNNIKLGQRVFLTAATLPDQAMWFANEGIITQIDQTSAKTSIQERAMATGGPLFNVNGELIGLNVVDAQGNLSVILVNKIQEFLGL